MKKCWSLRILKNPHPERISWRGKQGYLIFLRSVSTGISDSSFGQAWPIWRRLRSHGVYPRDTRASHPRQKKKEDIKFMSSLFTSLIIKGRWGDKAEIDSNPTILQYAASLRQRENSNLGIYYLIPSTVLHVFKRLLIHLANFAVQPLFTLYKLFSSSTLGASACSSSTDPYYSYTPAVPVVPVAVLPVTNV
jgi:hypothetical protein